jgi:hypothetical protein
VNRENDERNLSTTGLKNVEMELPERSLRNDKTTVVRDQGEGGIKVREGSRG